MAPKKAETPVAYRVNGILDISVRDMGVRPRLGMRTPERQWEYVIKLRGSLLFKGTDLYTDKDTLHSEAAATALRYFVPENGNLVEDLPWIDAHEAARSASKAAWFMSDYRFFVDVVNSIGITYITEFADVFAILGDGSLAPFGQDGLAVYGDTLDELRNASEPPTESDNYDGMFATV